MILQTERLILRPWKKNKADAKALYSYAKHPAIGPAAGWPPHISVNDSLEVIRNILSVPEMYAVVPRSVGHPVGCAGIVWPGAGTGRKYLGSDEAEIGYWIGVPFWGQGLIPEAVRALLRRCFEELGCSAVWCAYYEGNEKSRRVQEKCGFTYHHTVYGELCAALGEKRTEHFSRITKEEYLAALSSQSDLHVP